MELKNPKEVERILQKTGDKLGLGIDTNIFRSLVILNSLGYKTTSSCEGHIDRLNTSPYIFIEYENLNSEDTYKKDLQNLWGTLLQDLNEFYKNRNTPYDKIIKVDKLDEENLVVLLNFFEYARSFENRREEKLKSYLQEINDFCEFLNKKYQLNY